MPRGERYTLLVVAARAQSGVGWLEINGFQKKGNHMITTDTITKEINAQLAAEIPWPAGGFETEAERIEFTLRRDARKFELVFQLQKILNLDLATDEQRVAFLALYRHQSKRICRQARMAHYRSRQDPREVALNAFLKEMLDPRFRVPTDEEIGSYPISY